LGNTFHIIHFLCLPKENESKERAPASRVSHFVRDTLRFSNLPGLLKLVPGGTQTVNNPSSAATAMLGYGPMGFISKLPSRGYPDASCFECVHLATKKLLEYFPAAFMQTNV
jgi:hypothetical protein